MCQATPFFQRTQSISPKIGFQKSIFFNKNVSLTAKYHSIGWSLYALKITLFGQIKVENHKISNSGKIGHFRKKVLTSAKFRYLTGVIRHFLIFFSSK